MNQLINIEQDFDFNTIANEQERIIAMCRYTRKFCNVVPEACLQIGKEALQLSTKTNNVKGQTLAMDQVAYQLWHHGKIDEANALLSKSLQIKREENYYYEYGWHVMTKGMILWADGNYDGAFKEVYDGIRLLEQKNDIEGQGMCYWALGVFHYDLKDYDKSLSNYQKVMDIIGSFESFDNNAACYALIGLGCCYKGKGDLAKALDYFLQARQKSSETNQWMQEARTHYEIGLLHVDQDKLEQAEEQLKHSYTMRKEHNTKPGMVSCLIALSDLEVKRNNLPIAMQYMEEALDLAIATNTKVKIYQCQQKLYELSKLQNNYKEALHYMEEYHKLKQEVVGEEANNKLKDVQTKYATERSEREAEIERLRNVELKKAHDLVAEKNKEILDSIQYAKRIQSAILPPTKLIKQYLENSFILYKPKDIIAGDFYWMETEGDNVFFAAADCTGHGVPGAMVSVMCSTALSKTVKEDGLVLPGAILDKTVEYLEQQFKKSEEEVKDGMDLALCCLNLKAETLEYAGANNPLYLIRDGVLQEIKADKQPVGKHINRQPYTNHCIKIKKGDCFYIFTDGFADQFGGAKGKKFKYQPFKQLLLDNHNKPMEKQKAVLDTVIENWKGQLEQVDDICVIGFRI